MNHIMGTILVILILAMPVFAIEDLTTDGTGLNSGGIESNDDIRLTASIARLEAQILRLNESTEKNITRDDLQNFKNNVNGEIDSQLTMILINNLILLLVWQLFFFATFFYAKRKEWF